MLTARPSNDEAPKCGVVECGKLFFSVCKHKKQKARGKLLLEKWSLACKDLADVYRCKIETEEEQCKALGELVQKLSPRYGALLGQVCSRSHMHL